MDVVSIRPSAAVFVDACDVVLVIWVIAIPNASPFETGKLEKRIEICARRARETGLPVLYVNQIGGQDAQCFVSLAADDPDRYAVAIRRPTKWSHPNWTAPKDCRGLYRHDKDAAINPSPQQGPPQFLARPLPRRDGAPASINSGL